ncbi:hypothetical protein Tsubulata_027828, partial [Turnera subulata]
GIQGFATHFSLLILFFSPSPLTPITLFNYYFFFFSQPLTLLSLNLSLIGNPPLPHRRRQGAGLWEFESQGRNEVVLASSVLVSRRGSGQRGMAGLWTCHHRGKWPRHPFPSSLLFIHFSFCCLSSCRAHFN